MRIFILCLRNASNHVMLGAYDNLIDAQKECERFGIFEWLYMDPTQIRDADDALEGTGDAVHASIVVTTVNRGMTIGR